MNPSLRLTVAAAVAVLLSSAALAPVYSGLGWLLPVAGAVVAVSAATGFARSRGVPLGLQPVVGLTALAVWTVALYARSTLSLGVLPSGKTVARLRTLLGEALLDVDALAAPVPTATGLVLLAVLGVGALTALVDLIAVGLVRPAAAGLPLLLLFAVPSGTVAGGVGWWPFVLGAAGWLGLLLAESGDRVMRWGAAPTAAGTSYSDPGVHRVGRRIGAAALGVAVVVPALVPGLDARLFESGGGGLGGGSRSTTTYNPITRLADQLRLPSPQPLLTYRTDDPSPDYVRLTTLDLYDGAGWSASRLSGDRDDLVSEGVPEPIGLEGTATRAVRTEFTVAQLDGPWLPVTVPPREIALEGPWLWDREAETVFSTRRTVQDVEQPYAVTAARVEPTVERLRAGGPLVGDDIPTLALPPEVTDYVRELTEQVVEGQTTDYDRVAALQAFFTDPGNGFRYSEDSTVPGTNSPDALENFLRPENGGRRGFCEQYASAMAAMVRVLGIPARVSVGFTPGRRQDDGSFLVTTADAHAWPEVWFNGAGWVRFEPTPRGEIVDVPGYTVPPVAAPVDPSAPDTAQPSEAPSAGAGGPNPLRPDGLDPFAIDGAPTAVDTGAEEESGLGRIVVLLLAVALVLALVPLALAAVRRRRRWAQPSPAVAWAQMHDDAADVGHRWRPQDSPRAAAAHLLASRPLPEGAAAALTRLATKAERARFAGRPVDSADDTTLVEDAREVRSGLAATAPARDRWRARLLPPSTLRWASAGLGSRTADALDRVDEALASAGRRLSGALTRRA